MSESEALELSEDSNLYFRIVSEGLTTRTVQEFRDELEGIAMHTASPALRQKCREDMDRFGEVVTLTVANGR